MQLMDQFVATISRTSINYQEWADKQAVGKKNQQQQRICSSWHVQVSEKWQQSCVRGLCPFFPGLCVGCCRCVQSKAFVEYAYGKWVQKLVKVSCSVFIKLVGSIINYAG